MAEKERKGPQMILPIFGDGVELITSTLGYEKRDGTIYYHHGGHPIFSHSEDDIQSFRMITSQFCVNGACKQADIIRAFGVPKISVLRAVKRYREEGPGGLYKDRRPKRKPRVLTDSVVQKAEELLAEGASVKDACAQLGIKHGTFQKAVRSGRIRTHQKKTGESKRSTP